MNSTKISLISAGIGSAVSATSAIYAFRQSNKAKGEADQLKIDLQNAEANRQAVVNPFAGVTNPFANLGVATKAAEFQAEQADVALANTLDAVRQSGAGGATALAQAALKSKQGISADIQKQELDNSRLRAKGEMAVQKIVAEGEKFKWEAQEKREMQKLNRLQAQLDNQTAAQMAYRQAGIGALTDMAGNIMSVASSFAGQEQDTVTENIMSPEQVATAGSLLTGNYQDPAQILANNQLQELNQDPFTLQAPPLNLPEEPEK